MKTIKLKIMNSIDLNYELRTYNSVVHFAYNRFHNDFFYQGERCQVSSE